MNSFRPDRSIDSFYMMLLQVCILTGCFAVVLLHLPDPLHFISDNDWGLQLAAADQILGGEHPFIDFPIYYGPLTPYASALAQLLLQKQPLAELLLVSTGYTLAYFLLFNLFRQISGNLIISLLMLCVSLLLMPRMYKYYILLCPVLVMSGIFWYLKKPRLLQLFAVALTVVLTGLYRQDYGAYAFLTCSFILVLKPLEGCDRLVSIFKFCCAVLLFTLPWLVFLVFHGSFINYLQTSIFQAPRAIMSIALPYSMKGQDLSGIFADFPSVLFLISQSLPTVGLILLLILYRKFDDVRWVRLAALILFAQLCLIQGMHRQDYQHTLQAIPLALVLCCWLISIACKAFLSSSLFSKVTGGLALLIFSGLGIYCIQYNVIESRSYRDSAEIRQLVEDYKIFAQPRQAFVDSVARKNPNTVQIRTLRYIAECTRPGERIAAYVRLTSLYYFADRMFGGGIMSVNPGLLTQQQEREVIAKLRNQEPVLFIDNPLFNYGIGNRGVFGIYSPLLHQFLAENFITVRAWGGRTISVNRRYLATVPQRCLSGDGKKMVTSM
ncbi:MAG: hypothetical protein JRC87_00250 [Deltaproteobacteria bacterium]|nr:hypothetical protein [Deltaproteobacteria bacterium]MBW2658022.1 hypothetical protein [Deltaproteobacteria bacterium]